MPVDRPRPLYWCQVDGSEPKVEDRDDGCPCVCREALIVADAQDRIYGDRVADSLGTRRDFHCHVVKGLLDFQFQSELSVT